MAHRHILSTSPMVENEQDQNWSHMHPEQPYAHLATSSPPENGSLYYPGENLSLDSSHFPPNWNSSSRTNGFSSSSHNVEASHYAPVSSVPSHDHFLNATNGGPFCMVPGNYARHSASSSYERQSFHYVDGSFVDLNMDNGRGPHKRKSPGIPNICERGNTSRYFGAGSSSDLPMSSESRLEKSNVDPQNIPWDHPNMTPGYRGNGLAIRGEGSLRNVRSRSAIDLETNLARPHLLSNPSQNSFPPNNPIDPPISLDLPGPSSGTLPREWGHINMPPVQGRMLVPDTSGFSHESNQFLLGSSATDASVEVGGYPQDFITSRPPIIPQSFQGTSVQAVRGARSGYSQRQCPYFTASSSSQLGQLATSDESLQTIAENYSSRHPRPLSTIGWRSGDRNSRSRISNGRHRSVADDAGIHDRLTSQGFMVIDRSAMYGARNILDQHRDMRLDIDNMSYEELLALGERIGSVSTGLPDDMISKCLTESIYCSSDQMQDEETCVICLEEYKNMDDVGTLKSCGHDYHVSCIKKWLSMKNLCPICKGSALPDHLKDK